MESLPVHAPTIYFLQSDPPSGPVKIGYTRRRAQDRVAEGQTFSSTPVRVLVETLGSRADEARLHRVFASSRVRGEWFLWTPELQELVLYLIEGGSLQNWFS